MSGTKSPKKKVNKKIGRREKITKEFREALLEAFLMDATDAEAISYANRKLELKKGKAISERTFYHYQARHPDFLQEKNACKNVPILKARASLVRNLDKPKVAQWFLERKRKEEFSPRSELTGPNGSQLIDIKDNPAALTTLLKVALTAGERIKAAHDNHKKSQG
jgi:hypothetical protein